MWQFVVAVWTVCSMVLAVAADQKLYHVTKVSPSRVGDRRVIRAVDVLENSVTLPDGTVVKDLVERLKVHCISEVLEVDEAGKSKAVRVTIVSARQHAAASVPKERAFRKDTVLERIHFVARRKGLALAADTTTIVSEKAETLTASELSVLKMVCGSATGPAGGLAKLLPAKPVAVGHTWQPTRRALRAAEVSSLEGGKKPPGKLLGAEFRFVSVTDGIALIEGSIRWQGSPAGGKTVTVPVKLRVKIDTTSGRRVGVTRTMPLTLKLEQGTVKWVGKAEATVTFTPGTGRASALPKGLFNIGWKPAGKDTNNYKDAANGFSLNLPKGYVARKLRSRGSAVATFVKGKERIIKVFSAEYPRHFDVDQVIPGAEANYRRKIPPAEVQKLALPGNVPAILIQHELAVPGGEKHLALVLQAVDGRHGVLVYALGPVRHKAHLGEMRTALKSLRVFKPAAARAE